jgi:hypothetical protein
MRSLPLTLCNCWGVEYNELSERFIIYSQRPYMAEQERDRADSKAGIGVFLGMRNKLKQKQVGSEQAEMVTDADGCREVQEQAETRIGSIEEYG